MIASGQSCLGDTDQAGSYPTGASPYGVLDMAGNVAEWVNDWYQDDYYPDTPGDNPPGPASGEFSVLRGGAYYSGAGILRVASREFNNPGIGSPAYGFRCAVSAKP
jgi:formylglycine-generating enzyme required for sulfatase activity